VRHSVALVALTAMFVAISVLSLPAAGATVGPLDQGALTYDGPANVAREGVVAAASEAIHVVSDVVRAAGRISDPSAYLVATNTADDVIRRPGPGTPHVDDMFDGLRGRARPTSPIRPSRRDRIGSGAAMGPWGAAGAIGTTRRLPSRCTRTSATGARSDPTTTIGRLMARGRSAHRTE